MPSLLPTKVPEFHRRGVGVFFLGRTRIPYDYPDNSQQLFGSIDFQVAILSRKRNRLRAKKKVFQDKMG